MIAKKIESIRNSLVKEAIELRDKRSQPRHTGFLIEGPNLVESALASKGRCRIKRLFYTEVFGKKNPGLMKQIRGSSAELCEVREHIISRLSDTQTPQGIIAMASCVKPEIDPMEKGSIFVVLDGVQDPGNTGTIIRTSEAAGASAVVILPGTCDPFSPKAMRASAGSIFSIPVIMEASDAFIRKLKKLQIPIVVTEPSAKKSLFDSVLRPPLALVFGNEANGISAEVLAASSMKLRVPIRGVSDSLNVASTAAVCIYEALRQSLS